EPRNFVAPGPPCVARHRPWLDETDSALAEDLRAHGLPDEMWVVTIGDFGRTPWVNEDAGRDHGVPGRSRRSEREDDAQAEEIAAHPEEKVPFSPVQQVVERNEETPIRHPEDVLDGRAAGEGGWIRGAY